MKKLLILICLGAFSFSLVAEDMCPADCKSCEDMRLECQEARKKGCACVENQPLGEREFVNDETGCLRNGNHFSRANPKARVEENQYINDDTSVDARLN